MSGILSLYELNHIIRSAIENAFPDTFLVAAEIASCDVKNHCYLTLVDKEEETIRAEMRATIWANRYRAVSKAFEEETGIKLAKGIKILFQAEVSFHERYGLKLNILNIDPTYTIGELAVKRKEILDRLTNEGLKDRNKLLEFPLVPQRIGIISSSTSAGYDDLMNHLTNNVYGYTFTTRLYEALMQGDRAEMSIVDALNQCFNDAPDLDVAVIVRGGGGQTDLQCFDSYEIGKAIALLPLPVISGIGHQRDVTVVDEVSKVRAKTPTAVADLLITKVRAFEDNLDTLAYRLISGANRLTSDAREELSSLSKSLEITARRELLDNVHNINALIKGLHHSLLILRNEKQRLEARESNIKYLNPRNVLRRGYSITYNHGKPVKAESFVHEGDSLKTILYEGEITSKVICRNAGKRKGDHSKQKTDCSDNLPLYD